MMILHAWDWIVIAAYAGIVVLLGLRASKHRSATAEEYILSGRKLTLPSFVAALVTTWYGGILGVGEFSYLHGLSNWIVFGLPYYLFALLFAMVFARRVRDSAVFSIPDMFHTIYGRRQGFLAAVFVFFISTPAPYIFMQAVLVQAITGWPLIVCILLGTAVSVTYMLTGGLRSVVLIDRLQFMLMFGGFFLILGVLVSRHGLFPFLTNALPPGHVTLFGDNSWQYILVWFLIALWTLVAPQFHQFTLSARSPATARKGILISIGFWLVFDCITTLTGMYARALLPGLAQPSMSYPLLGEAVLPPLLKGIFFISMFATVVSTSDGLTFISAVTVGRDLLARRADRLDDASVKRFTRTGILFTAATAIAAIMLFPSVINLWYAIGTVFIPAILLPLVSAYFPGIRLSRGLTLAAMIAGFATSLSWFSWGRIFANGEEALYPLGIEPMIAGLAATVILYVVGKMRRPAHLPPM
jgi:solute:Na+ symporter, SSS family